ncbi:MAG: ATP-binding protein [Oscillospiraceae bacterium]
MAHGEKAEKKQGITRRWIIVSLLTTIVILAVSSLAIYFSTRQSYYNSARQAISYRIKTSISEIPTATVTPEEKVSAVLGLVSNFNEKDRFELMIVDTNGAVIATSSGFSYSAKENIDDFWNAMENPDGYGESIGRTLSGEHVLAVTQLLSSPVGSFEAIRIVSSLRKIDDELGKLIGIAVMVCLVILFFVIFSGMYFIRSIVIPLRDIGFTTKRIAHGDYSVRIENKYNDEIGTLCENINEMAVGLTATDAMKNEFISSVSHELRTPLTSIKGWGETLFAVGPQDEETFKDGMKIIMNETDRLSVMVEDLLDFSRLETKKLKMNFTRLDLIAELSDAVLAVVQRANRTGIEIEYAEPEEPAVVRADKNRLKQVFGNIFDNAVKYSKPGGTIKVGIEKDGGFASVTVTDSGPGIPENELPKITQKFFKASNSTMGSGIGLAVVAEIMESHKGRLIIDSELGKGTSVTVRLPLET